MAEFKAIGGMDGVPEFERILQSLSDDATQEDERVQAYFFLLELLKLVDSDGLNRRIYEVMSVFCRCIQRDVVSSNEEISSLALRTLGCLFHRKNFVTELPDDEAAKFLLTLVALITTTDKKVVCSLGLWCLAVQDLKHSVLEKHLKIVVSAVLFGIENPLGSMGVTFEAFQAVTHLAKQLPRGMRNLSWLWVPPVYQKLLNSNTKTVEFAEKCLYELQSILLPPLPKLSESLAADIQQRFLSKMEEMMKQESRAACIAVQAWGWFVKLLGVKLVEETSLANMMLKLLESPFVNPSAQVRTGSQVAWVSIIDAFVPSLGETAANGSPGSLDTSFTGVQLSRKRLNLLLVPLLKTMSWEKDVVVQRNCCCTWIYLLCRLGQLVNERPIFDAAVVPMLEIVFNLDPEDRDESVWQACVDMLLDALSCKGMVEASSDAGIRTAKGVSQSPKTPVGITFTGVFSESHHKNISWRSWHLDRLDSLMKMVHLLWKCRSEQSEKVEIEDEAAISLPRKFEAARECFRLVVRGVEAEGRNTLRPSSDHVTAVHLLMEFLSVVCMDHPSEDLLSSTWTLVEILIDVLGPAVMASSFYRMHLQFAELTEFMEEKHGDSGSQTDSSLPDTVTPIVHVSAAWFRLVFETSFEGQREDMWLPAIEKIVTAGRAGFDVMGNYHGFACILDHLAKGSYLHQGESPSIKKSALGELSKSEPMTKQNWCFLLALWRTVAENLKEQVERSNDVAPVGGCQRDSGYQVVLTVLLFPVKSFLLLPPSESKESRSKLHENLATRHGRTQLWSSQAELLSVQGPWFKLFDSALRISSLKNPQPNSFIGEFFNRVIKFMKSSFHELSHQVTDGVERLDFDTTKVSNQWLRFLGDIVAHTMKHAEISNLAMLAISRKRRKTGYGASSVRVQCIAGMELEDANNLKDLLTVASRFLTLSYEKYKQEKRRFTMLDPVIRVLGALISLMQHITSQNDSVLLLEALAQPMICWFTANSETSASGADGRSQASHLPDSLLEGLAQAWDGLLLCLQNCRPCLVFDSNLLLAQASSLAPAFLHHHDSISNRTLAFWESTYGSKAVALKYPPALVEVFNKLKQKVDISLPGWTMRPVAAEERHPRGAPELSYRQPLPKVGRQFGERIQSMMNAVEKRVVMREDHRRGPEGSREMISSSSDQLREELGQQMSQQATHMKPMSHTEHCNEDSGELRCPVNGVDNTSPTQHGEFMPTPEGNAVIDALMMDCVSLLNPEETSKVTSPEETAISPDLELPTDLLALNEVGRMDDSQACGLPSMLEITDLLQTCTRAASEANLESGLRKSASVDNKEHEPAGEVPKRNGAADRVIDGTKGTPALVTPPIVFNDVPSLPPKMPVGAERPQGAANAGFLQVSVAADGSKGSQAGSKLPRSSKLPRRRKKLKFQEDSQDVEYVVIPPTQKKKAGPLTDRQREIRLSQRTSGRVVKTYTAADFSQSGGADDLVDSQIADGVTEATCKENIPSNLPRLRKSTSGGAARRVGAEDVAQSSEKDDSICADDFVKTVPLDKVDYIQLKARLTTLLQDDPTLTFRQIFHREQYEYLPRLIQRRLSSHLSKLRKHDAGLPEINDAAEPTAKRVTIQPRMVLGPSPSDDKANPRQSRDLAKGEEIKEHIPSSHLLRRKPELHGHCQKSVSLLAVNLRSSGKLRGGKHWRINSELGRVITARLGIKKIVAKRRQIFSNLSLKIEERKVPSTRVAKNIVVIDQDTALPHQTLVQTVSSSQMQKNLSREEIIEVQAPLPTADLAPSSAKQKNSPATVAVCNEEITEVQASQPIGDLDLSIEMLENSPFQVRNLNRGLLASTYISSARVEEDLCAQDIIQACTSTRISNHNPRKCRVPKRFPSQEGSLDASPSLFRNTVKVSEAGDGISSGGPNEFMGLWETDAVQLPFDTNRLIMGNACSSMQINVSPPEGLPFRLSGGAHGEDEVGDVDEYFLQNTLEQQLNCETMEGSTEKLMPNIDEYFQTPAETFHMGLEPDPERLKGLGAGGLQTHTQTDVNDNPQSSTAEELAEDPGKEPISNVQALLEREDVQVCQVLTALLTSSKWKEMKATEVVQAEKLLYQLREAILGHEPCLFVTPPTQF